MSQSRFHYVILLLLSLTLLPFFSFPVQAAGEKGAAWAAPTPELDVIYHVRGGKLFLEFHVNHFLIKKAERGKGKVYGEGHIHLYLDGKKVAAIDKPVYLLPHLPPGKHRVKVELAHHDHSTYGIFRTFSIEVKGPANP